MEQWNRNQGINGYDATDVDCCPIGMTHLNRSFGQVLRNHESHQIAFVLAWIHHFGMEQQQNSATVHACYCGGRCRFGITKINEILEIDCSLMSLREETEPVT